MPGFNSKPEPALEPIAPAAHVPAAGPSRDLTVLERLEAFRDLIRHGNALLGEVVVYCRQAEAAVADFAAEKATVDQMRAELQTARQQAEADAAAARRAVTELERQRSELDAVREELMQTRTEMEAAQRTQHDSSDTLERSLREARQQQAELEKELSRIRAQALPSRSLDTRLSQLDQLQGKLRQAEQELADTRNALEQERSRRDRALALIKPRAVDAEPARVEEP